MTMIPFASYAQMPIDNEVRTLDSFDWLRHMPTGNHSGLFKNIEYIFARYMFHKHATAEEKYFLKEYEGYYDKYTALQRMYQDIITRHERLVEAHNKYIEEQSKAPTAYEMMEMQEEAAETARWDARGISKTEQAKRRMLTTQFNLDELTRDELIEKHIDDDGIGYVIYDKMAGQYTVVMVSKDTIMLDKMKIVYFKKEGWNVARTFSLHSARLRGRAAMSKWRTMAYDLKNRLEGNDTTANARPARRSNSRVDHVRAALGQADVDENLNTDIF